MRVRGGVQHVGQLAAGNFFQVEEPDGATDPSKLRFAP
jgi:hypothetical protein